MNRMKKLVLREKWKQVEIEEEGEGDHGRQVSGGKLGLGKTVSLMDRHYVYGSDSFKHHSFSFTFGTFCHLTNTAFLNYLLTYMQYALEFTIFQLSPNLFILLLSIFSQFVYPSTTNNYSSFQSKDFMFYFQILNRARYMAFLR